MNGLKKNDLKDFLNEKVYLYKQIKFIEEDPLQIPYRFSLKEDKEIAAFFSATFAWGNRKSIIKKSTELMNLFDNEPHKFILYHSKKDLQGLKNFKHRTFNYTDLIFFIESLQNIYLNLGGLENQFLIYSHEKNTAESIERFRNAFFSIKHQERTKKHIASPKQGSTTKRLNMFLRWMVRQDTPPVDMGLWKSISPSKLSCPLDTHSGSVARKLGLLTRKQNDQKSVNELDTNLRKLDPVDPVKYDFALFGLGIYENFSK